MAHSKIKLISPRSLGKAAWFIVHSVGKTMRIDERFADSAYRIGSNSPVIYVLWHGRMFLPMYCLGKDGITILVSEHRDGEIVTSTLMSAGFDIVRGSTTRGGIRALAKLVRLARKGARIGITVDGPTGPRGRFQSGAVFIAAKTGLPLVPVTGSADRAHYFKSWDALQFPFPFSRGILNIGEPYYITGGIDSENIEFHRAELERRLYDLNREADEIIGAKAVI